MVITTQNINQKPGYKQTDVGVIPEDWEVCSLGEVVTKVGSGITPTGGEKVYKKEGRPFLRSQNVGWGHLLLDDIAFIDEETHSSFLATEIKSDDVLLNITGASIGRSAVADDRLLGGNVNQHVCIIRTDVSKLNPYYLNFFLLSENGQKQIDSFQAGGNRQGLNFGQIKSFEIPLPPLPEQQAIATALSDVDALITSLDQLIAKKRDIKQATMQQLLTGKMRLPGFSGELKLGYKQTEAGMIPEEWELCSLGEVVTKVGSGITPTGGEKVYKKEGRPFLRSQNVGWGHLLFDDIAFIDEETHSSFLATEIKLDDVLLNITGASIGRSAVADDRLVGGNVNQHVCIIRADAHKLSPYYLNFFLLSENGQKQIESFQAGGNRQGLNFGQIKSFQIHLPNLPEQQAVAAILSDIDAEIAALEQKREKTRALKQGMMQALLTGKTKLI